MKIFYDNVTISLAWKFAGDNMTLRSNVLGGYQAEIYKSNLTIYNSQGQKVVEQFCGSRLKGRQMARNKIARFLEGW